jgi:N-carbamoyl-L-amino-acid hydrolase
MSSQAFLDDFHHVATIGSTPRHGVDRQAATPDDQRARDWFAAFAQERGWTVRVDSIGNVFALITFRPDAPFIIVGSHLDSQPLGGRFDGAYGVIAALHAAERVAKRAAETGECPEFNLAVVDWFNEEGGRFAPSIMGSSVFAGIKDRDEMLAVRDLAGTSVAEALSSIGYLGSEEGPEAAGYAEIHIEQGRILEREGLTIGAVDSSWYTQKLDIEVNGEQSHTGATAMADRRDALLAAAKIISMVHDVTLNFPAEELVSSVGQLTVEPNSPIVVARHAHLVADLRSNSPEIVRQARDTLRRQIAELAEVSGLDISVRDFDIRKNQYYPESGVDLTLGIAAELGLGARRMQTMAGHDSVAMNRIVPSVMIFIPSEGGVSHCEREFTSDADMVAGVDVLSEVVHRLVHGALAPSVLPGAQGRA